jgi:multiple sugar transport system substrate-binding protein
MTRPLTVALVGGPMYDPLYHALRRDGPPVEVVVHADHPTLNREVAARLGAGEAIDIVSTHSKYAPSQAQWLRPLDGAVDAAMLKRLAPAAVELCRHGGALLSVPRNIDVRVLWFRRDLLDEPPDTWDDVLTAAAGGTPFGFPGRESGLFGTFFELVTGRGGSLYGAGGSPAMAGADAEAACALLVELASHAPEDLPTWHYDQVDAALSDGTVAMAAVWPGGAGPLRASPHYEHLVPAPYPAGPARRVSYAGCHSWAIPRTCPEPDRAADLVAWLCSYEAGAVEAAHGSVCARTDAFADTEPIDATDEARLELARRAVEDQMITYPPHPRFPEVEDAGWQALHDALVGDASPAEAVARIQEAATAALT